MNKSKQHHYLNHFKHYFSGNFIVKALSLVTLPIISKLLDPKDYGIYSLFMVYVSFGTVLLTLNLPSAISRFWYDEDIVKKNFISTSIISSIFVYILISSFLIIFFNYIQPIVKFDFKFLLFILLFVLMKNIENIFKQINVALRKSKLISYLSVIYAVLLFISTLLFIKFADKNYSLIYANIFTGMVFLIIYLFYIREYLTIHFNYNYFRQNHRYSFPLLIDATSALVMVSIDKIMLEKYMGVDILGQYSFAYSIGNLLSSMIVYPLLMSWTPDYFEDMKNENYEKLTKDILMMFKLILAVSIAMILFYSEFVYTLFNKSYYDGFIVLPYIVMAGISLYVWQIYGRNIGYAKKNIYMIAITISAGLLNILLNYIFIPKYGMIAASITTLVSYLFMAIMGYLLSKYKFNIYVFDYKKLLKPLAILFFTLFVSQIYNTIDFKLSIVIQKIVVLVVSMIILFKSEIQVILKRKNEYI